jgi:hypothetical protein
MAQTVTIWFDKEADFLEVRWLQRIESDRKRSFRRRKKEETGSSDGCDECQRLEVKPLHRWGPICIGGAR